MAVLVASDIHKTYAGPDKALAGVGLSIDAGEVVALLGPNGAGKTTFITIACGVRQPDRGAVSVLGIDVLRHPARAQAQLGYAPQELAVYPSLTVRENLALFTDLAPADGRAAERCEELLVAFELTDLVDRPARFLSGGEQRRLHVAMALVHRPKLLLLDEPTAGVDVRSRAKVLELVRSLADDGAAICYSTHYLAEVETLGARVAILDRGSLVAQGSVEELVQRYGVSAVDLHFDGPPPPDLGPEAVVMEGNLLRVTTPDPVQEAPRILDRLAERTVRPTSVDLVQANLETVFLHLTSGAAADDGFDAAERAREEADA